ncbi:MAG: hypothetical protein Q8K99_11180 [Actinomycetota bacterium]|nr:hypothetical protein [Actinomycetota bacterium]
MILPPAIIYVSVKEADKKGWWFWLPLFLLWPLLLVLVALALCATVFVDIVTWLAGARFHRYTELILRLTSLLGECRGTCVDVDGSDRVNIRII